MVVPVLEVYRKKGQAFSVIHSYNLPFAFYVRVDILPACFTDRINSESTNTGQNYEHIIIEYNNVNENDESHKKEDNDSACHSRNSSSASHLSKLSHSRQSSSGESASGHMRYDCDFLRLS